MDFKKNIFGVIASLGIVAAASSAFAGNSGFLGSDRYIDLSLGYGLSDISFDDAELTEEASVDINNYLGYLSYGERFGENVRLELSVGHDRTKRKTFKYNESVVEYTSRIREVSNSVLLKTYYDLYKDQKISLYVMGGIGAGFNKASILKVDDDNTTDDIKAKDSMVGFAWQTGVGIGYNIIDDVVLHLDYRLGHNGSSKYKLWDSEDESHMIVKTKANSDFLLGVTYKF